MDLMRGIMKEIEVKRQATLAASKQLTLGGLIEKLRWVADKTKRVSFDVGNLHPAGLDSWRGSYAELALAYKETGTRPTVGELLTECQAAIGETFTGYKGGEFLMSETTPIWVANYGNSGSTGLVDVVESEFGVTLKTGHCEFA